MALSELLRDRLPLLPTKQRLQAIGGRATQFVQDRISHHGVIGEVFVLMVVFSGLRLLWASAFPVGWWVIMGFVFTYVAINDKFIWPKERERMSNERNIRELEAKILEFQKEKGDTTTT